MSGEWKRSGSAATAPLLDSTALLAGEATRCPKFLSACVVLRDVRAKFNPDLSGLF